MEPERSSIYESNCMKILKMDFFALFQVQEIFLPLKWSRGYLTKNLNNVDQRSGFTRLHKQSFFHLHRKYEEEKFWGCFLKNSNIFSPFNLKDDFPLNLFLPKSILACLFLLSPRMRSAAQQSMATTLPCASYKTEALDSPLSD